MDLFEKYFNYSLKYLSYRPRSEKEVHDVLIKKKASSKLIEKVINRLKELKFVDDEEFTRWFVEQRVSYKLSSKRILSFELKQKGISQDLILKYLTENTETAVNDFDQAYKLTQKKIQKYIHLNKNEIYQKLGGALARKGFSWDIIKRAIDLALSQNR